MERINKTMSTEEVQSLMHPSNLHLFKAILTNYLFPLISENEQAVVFTMFIQKKHNNPFIDTIISENIILTTYENHEDGFDFFLSTLSNDKRQACLFQLIESIGEPIEVLRLFIILLAIGGTKDDMNKYLELATKFWEKNFPFLKRYSVILLKTKIDLLIYRKEFFEAAEICERTYPLLDLDWSNEEVGWLKYQFARTMIILSKHVKMIVDISSIATNLEKIKERAEWEDQMRINF